MHVPTRLLALVELFGKFTFIIAFGAGSALTDIFFRFPNRPFVACARRMSLHFSVVTDRDPLQQPNG
jgi:hypothetical protein